MGARALGRRLERGVERSARVETGARGHRHRHCRLAPDSLGRVRDVDDQADARARLDARDRPLAPTFDHPGPMARTSCDSEPLLAAMAGVAPASRGSLRRYTVSPRVAVLAPDVADGLDRALAALPGRRVEPAAVGPARRPLGLLDIVLTEMLLYHRRFDDGRDGYRPAIRARRIRRRGAMTAEEYIGCQARRTEDTAAWCDWLAEHRIDAIVEPTVRSSPPRWERVRRAFGDLEDLSLTHYWDWTGFPVVSLPSGVGKRSGLPVGVSLIGAPDSDWDLLAWGSGLQDELGTVTPP